MSPKNDTQKSAKSTTVSTKRSQGFTDEEKAAMKARVKEARSNKDNVDGESEVLAAIESMQEGDRAMATRLHNIIKANFPDLAPKTWYGMPAYAKDGKNLCFFQNAQKFKTRYATLGFSDKADLDDGNLWPVAFALKELNPATEAKVIALVKKAAS
jgi:uncharacterized protein YdhG (YjbR/CyaY superfamily)